MADKKNNTIAVNKKVRHEFFIEQSFEAGLALEGWEVKSLRAGKGQLVDSYVLLKNNEAWLLGSVITPLISICTHMQVDPQRTRKLLLHKQEIMRLTGSIQRQGYTCVALSLYWKQGRVKCEIGLAKGKKLHDIRATEKAKDWNRQKQRLLRTKR